MSTVVNKTFLSLLTSVWLAFAALSGPAQAAASSGDYVRMDVPDVAQAVGFLQQAMNCNVISSSLDAPDHAAAEAALMDCGNGIIVELAGAPVAAPASKRATGRVIEFPSANAVAAAAWLRSHGATVPGTPDRITSGPNAGRVVVNFITPWGQPMRLVGWSHRADATGRPAGVGLAAE
jgi:hypothetical protein